jgi:hypothetical protein
MMTREKTKFIVLSVLYNMNDKPVLASHPELGSSPHAQAAMKALGITYAEAIPMSASDQWVFCKCENIPEELPRWCRVQEEFPILPPEGSMIGDTWETGRGSKATMVWAGDHWLLDGKSKMSPEAALVLNWTLGKKTKPVAAKVDK